MLGDQDDQAYGDSHPLRVVSLRLGCRSGTTLVELIVALAVLGILLGVSTAALGAIHRDTPSHQDSVLATARVKALHEGVAVRVDLPDSSGRAMVSVLLLPDGRVVGQGLDPLTGERSDATR